MRYRLQLGVLLTIGILLWENIGLFAQTLDPESQSAPPAGEEAIVLPRSSERDIPIGESNANQRPRTGSFFTVLQMVLVLALAAAAVYGVVFFLKRISRTPEQKDPHLKVLAAAHLGSNRFVHVVSVGSKAWLIGAGESGVSLISEIADSEAVDAMLLDASRKNAETEKLSDFARLLSRVSGKELPSVQPDLNAENVRKRRERLRGL
ncbi:MAG: flagellar biosynthetic protein FliO [Spirochaetaceae bacterium]|jgi:flagellar protein FliO/FliZ|nr:flagellar biosynthetic protein FliO [Spirochaetaceae bacterium]